MMQRYQDLREWENNELVDRCWKCKKRFGLFVWRHHCRACGRIMCKRCSHFYTKLPVDELCPGCPNYVSNKHPVRCCRECSDRVHDHRFQATLIPAEAHVAHLIGVRIIASLDYHPNFHSKVYSVHLPIDRTVFAGQILRVRLGGRVNRVVVPYGVGAGDTFYVRANDVLVHYLHNVGAGPQVVAVDTTQVVDQVIERLHQLGELHSDGTAIDDPGYDSEEEESERDEEPGRGVYRAQPARGHGHGQEDQRYVECPVCTYFNLRGTGYCEMCYASL